MSSTRNCPQTTRSCALGNLGDLYLNQDKLKEAREYLETAVEISSEVGYKVPEGAFWARSRLHRRENDFEESRRASNVPRFSCDRPTTPLNWPRSVERAGSTSHKMT